MARAAGMSAAVGTSTTNPGPRSPKRSNRRSRRRTVRWFDRFGPAGGDRAAIAVHGELRPHRLSTVQQAGSPTAAERLDEQQPPAAVAGDVQWTQPRQTGSAVEHLKPQLPVRNDAQPEMHGW